MHASKKQRLLLRAVVLATAFVACAAADARAAERPNILFVFTDDHASHAISAYGSKINKTPHIDRLATEGMLFRNCFVTNSICAPSRAVILTGKHSHRNGVIDNRVEFDTSQPTFPKLLRKAGYETAILGKWHLKAEPTGFDHWKVLIGQGTYYNPKMRTPEGVVNPTGYTTDIITDLALEWLDGGRDPEKPFMLMYQHKAPHREWLPGPAHLTMYDGTDLWEPPTLFDDYQGRTSATRWASMSLKRHMNDLDLKLELPRYLNDQQRARLEAVYGPKNEAMRRANLEGDDLVRWKYQRYMKDYLRCIASVDDNLGRVFDYLDRSGLAKNTVVIYNSDQGFYLGDHGWFDKRWMYEESLRMPLLVRWPGVTKPGSENRDLVQNLDFAETFLDLAGVEAPDDMQGESLVPLLRGQTPKDWRKSVYYQYFEFPGWHDVRRHCGVRTATHKLIHYYHIGEWELFDLQNDPDELKSVYDDPAYANVVTDLKAELARLRKEYLVDQFDEPPAAPVPANVPIELVLHYEPTPLDPNTIADASGNAHHGKRRNVKLVDGLEGQKAMQFAGNGAVVLQPPPPTLDPTYRPLTIAALVKPEAADGVVVAHGNQVFGYSLYLKNAVPQFTVRLSKLALHVSADKPIPLDDWTHLAATIEPEGRITLFVWGDPVGQLERGHFVTQAPRDGFNVGADLGGRVGDYETAGHFRGLISQVRLHWGALIEPPPGGPGGPAGKVRHPYVEPDPALRKYRLLREPNGHTVLGPNGNTVLRYMTRRPAATKLTANSVACLHPIRTPSGEVVTAFAPSDHPHHRGAFLAWYDLQSAGTRADFWGWGQFAPTEARVIQPMSLRGSGQEDGYKLLVESQWQAHRQSMLHEKLNVAVRQEGRANVIDLEYTFTAPADVTLAQGAFGGLCIRCRKDGPITFTGPDGPVSLPWPHYLKPETDWPAAHWYDLSVRLPDDRSIGIAVLDHPENPPTVWHNLANLAMLNPCIIASGPVTIQKNQPLTLRYRLVAHDGPAPTDLLKMLTQQWREPLRKSP